MNRVAAMLFLAVLTGTIAAAAASKVEGTLNAALDATWEEYKVDFKKQYAPGMEMIRRLVWESNVKTIQRHNLEYDMGQHTYSLGVNAFADMTAEEFRAAYLGVKLPIESSDASTRVFRAPLNVNDLPDTVDWRTKGYVTPVKDQGECGSCWAFSTTGSLEGQAFNKTKVLQSFSEQQLVDCSLLFGNLGCFGGLMVRAFNYIERHGIELETAYPYTATDNKCRYNESDVVKNVKVQTYEVIPSGNEEALQTAVATIGPISIAIDASKDSFRLYKQGVYNETTCSSTKLDHGVLAVGYGTEGGVPYWLVKNSWSATWGEEGYIKMSRNVHNQCGIATMAGYPTLQ